MKKYIAVILMIVMLCAFIPAFAQDEYGTETEQPAANPYGTSVPAQIQKGTITGIVVCPDEKDSSKLNPVGQTQVSLEDSSFSALTRADGTFSLTGLPYGDYKIVAKKEGFYSDEKIVTLSREFVTVTMTIASTKEKTVKTKPGKNISGSKTTAGMVFVAFASPASEKTGQAAAPVVGSLDDVMSWDPNQIQSAIAAGTDPRSIGLGYTPKYPHPYDPLVPQTSYQNSIMLFDAKTPAKTTYISLENQPYWLVYNNAVKLLYVSSQAQMVLVYDPGSNKTIGGINVKGQITDMCLNSDGTKLYIGVMGKQPSIYVLDCYKNKLLTQHVVPKRPAALAISPDGKTLYFAMGSSSSGVVYAINEATGSKTGEVKVGSSPNGMCVTPDGKQIYVANLSSASVSVIDTATLKVTATVSVGIEPLKLIASKDSKKVYVTCRKSNYVAVIDTDSNTVAKTINTGDAPTGIAITGDGSKVYVTNNASRTVSVIDTKNDTVVQTTQAQPRSTPWGIAVK